jgi:hypothetical protein
MAYPGRSLNVQRETADRYYPSRHVFPSFKRVHVWRQVQLTSELILKLPLM